MLTAYLTATRNLLQLPTAPSPLYDDPTLTTAINTARSQVAGDGECIRNYASLALANNVQVYNFSSISGLTAGVAGVLNVRMITLQVAGGNSQVLNAWPFEYFNQYFLAKTGVANSLPTDWAQYGQGVLGSLFFSPTPNGSITANLDTVCYPIPLVNDATAEAIPYPWTDSIPYFAAYLALLGAQSGARSADANRMFERYGEFKDRARKYSTPTVLPFQYDQSGSRRPAIPAGLEMAKGQ